MTRQSVESVGGCPSSGSCWTGGSAAGASPQAGSSNASTERSASMRLTARTRVGVCGAAGRAPARRRLATTSRDSRCEFVLERTSSSGSMVRSFRKRRAH